MFCWHFALAVHKCLSLLIIQCYAARFIVLGVFDVSGEMVIGVATFAFAGDRSSRRGQAFFLAGSA